MSTAGASGDACTTRICAFSVPPSSLPPPLLLPLELPPLLLPLELPLLPPLELPLPPPLELPLLEPPLLLPHEPPLELPPPLPLPLPPASSFTGVPESPPDSGEGDELLHPMRTRGIARAVMATGLKDRMRMRAIS
jgi:hypothetical protein